MAPPPLSQPTARVAQSFAFLRTGLRAFDLDSWPTELSCFHNHRQNQNVTMKLEPSPLLRHSPRPSRATARTASAASLTMEILKTLHNQCFFLVQ
jgi:hypothetical protein